jgi:hypothetical protein
MLSPQNFWPTHNFAALDTDLSDFDNAQFVVIPVPYDATTTLAQRHARRAAGYYQCVGEYGNLRH